MQMLFFPLRSLRIPHNKTARWRQKVRERETQTNTAKIQCESGGDFPATNHPTTTAINTLTAGTAERAGVRVRMRVAATDVVARFTSPP